VRRKRKGDRPGNEWPRIDNGARKRSSIHEEGIFTIFNRRRTGYLVHQIVVQVLVLRISGLADFIIRSMVAIGSILQVVQMAAVITIVVFLVVVVVIVVVLAFGVVVEMLVGMVSAKRRVP